MKFTCLVVDDNPIERDVVTMLLNKSGVFSQVTECEGAAAAISIIGNQHIDVVYCDIDMGDFSGIELLKSLQNPPVFVFVTSYGEYAIESYQIDAFDFIVKPVTAERILKSVQKVTAYLELKEQATKNQLENIQEVPAGTSDHFFIRENHEITRLKYSDVFYMESMGDFTVIYTEDKKYITLVNLKNMEAQLPDAHFRRIHKQYIINLSHIQSISQSHVMLISKKQVPISLANRQEFLEKFVEQKTITRFRK